MRHVLLLALVVAAVSSPLEAGTKWINQDNATCVGNRDPEEFCTGSGSGNGDGKWHLDTSLSDVKWMQACTARVLASGDVPVCDAVRQVSTGLNSCPASEDGNRFPLRRQDATLIQNGDGNAGCIGGGDPDACCDGPQSGTCNNFDKWPGGTWSDRPELDSSRNKWRNSGTWSAAFPASDCRNLLKDLAKKVIDNSAVRGERILDLQGLPIGETVPEDP